MILLIAAHALSLNLIVVTANEQEFSRIPGLKVENWFNGLWGLSFCMREARYR